MQVLFEFSLFITHFGAYGLYISRIFPFLYTTDVLNVETNRSLCAVSILHFECDSRVLFHKFFFLFISQEINWIFFLFFNAEKHFANDEKGK